jgi:ufm1-conjugating enzyme 1
MDASLKKTLQEIPLHRTNAGPRDGDKWVTRLKEEYNALIEVRGLARRLSLGV